MDELRKVRKLSDSALTAELRSAVARERENLFGLLARLGEFDRRGLGPEKGFSSAFEYCTRVLGYSEPAAARRVVVARQGRRFPSLLQMLRAGALHLEGAALLAKHLASHNRRRLLRLARGKSQAEIERLVAGIAPGAERRDFIRAVAAAPAIPAPSAPERDAADQTGALGNGETGIENATRADAGSQAARSHPSAEGIGEAGELLIASRADAPSGREFRAPAELYRVSFDAKGETVLLLRRAQEVLRHRIPGGELDSILRLALTRLLETEDRDRRRPKTRRTARKAGPAATEKGAAATRRIPERVKQEVWLRDGGRCAIVGSDGVRCATRAWLEFDHIRPYALGGRSDQASGVRLACREHNQLLARRIFGARTGGGSGGTNGSSSP